MRFFCKKKLPQKCTKMFKYGHVKSDQHPHFTGGFAKYVQLKKGSYIFKVSPKLSDEEVRKLADLARLYLTDEEVERFGGQLTDILTYVGVLSELDTEGVPETCQVTGLSNVTMKDEIVELTDPDELLEVSPLDKKDHQIRIKRLM